jgi:hypothetical protein
MSPTVVLRSALRAHGTRVALQTAVPKAVASAPVQSVQVRCKATRSSGGDRKGRGGYADGGERKGRGGYADSGEKKGRGGRDDDLYDPYKIYQEVYGKPAVREFNPDMLDDFEDFEWVEPEEVMADKSWPQTSGTDMFTDLINVSDEDFEPEKLELVLQEFYRRVNHKPIQEIELPEMSVAVDPAHPNKEALEIMKLSLLNNGRLSMDDKNEILAGIVDEIDHLRKDKTKLFKDLD